MIKITFPDSFLFQKEDLKMSIFFYVYHIKVVLQLKCISETNFKQMWPWHWNHVSTLKYDITIMLGQLQKQDHMINTELK